MHHETHTPCPLSACLQLDARLPSADSAVSRHVPRAAAVMNDDATALMSAAQNDEQVVRALVEAGANLEAQMKSGHTALMLAAESGHEQAARDLINAGANVDHKKKPSKKEKIQLLKECGALCECGRVLRVGCTTCKSCYHADPSKALRYYRLGSHGTKFSWDQEWFDRYKKDLRSLTETLQRLAYEHRPLYELARDFG